MRALHFAVRRAFDRDGSRLAVVRVLLEAGCADQLRRLDNDNVMKMIPLHMTEDAETSRVLLEAFGLGSN